MNQRQSNLIVVLDAGSDRIRALAADVNEGALRYRGHAIVESVGMRKGLISDLTPAARAIKSACDRVEQIVRVNVDACVVGIGGANIASVNTTAAVHLGTRMRDIGSDDVSLAIERARSVPMPSGREILHVLTRQFVLDQQPGIHDPVGMIGNRLEADLHISTCSASALQSIVTCANRAGIEVEDTVFEGLAAAESTLTADDRELGICLLDIGAHSSELVVYFEGAVAHTASIPFGGQHFTNDLAVMLELPIAQAEQLKLQCGNAVVTAIPQLAEIDLQAPQSRKIRHRRVAEILEPRAWELMEAVRDSLRDGGVLEALGNGCVLTGGGALLAGLPEVAESILHVRTRIGQPVPLSRMPLELAHPANAVLIGMMLYSHRRRSMSTAERGSLRTRLRSLFAASA